MGCVLDREISKLRWKRRLGPEALHAKKTQLVEAGKDYRFNGCLKRRQCENLTRVKEIVLPRTPGTGLQQGMISPEYLNIADLSVYAGVSRNTLRKWMGSGMPYYKVDGCLRVKKSEFDAWMRQFRNGTDSINLDSIWSQVLEEVA